MGSETTKALRVRRREADARVARLIAAADERSPIGSARLARIKTATREGRRAMRALESAERTVVDAEAQVGAALIRVTQTGLSRSEAFELLGLRRAIGRRLIELAAPTRRTCSDFSTATPAERASSATQADGETGTSNTGGASNEGNL